MKKNALRRPKNSAAQPVNHVQSNKIVSLFRNIRDLCFMEYKRILSDPAVLLLFAGVQIMYPLIYPVPLYHQVVRDVPVALVDYDNSAASRQLARMTDATDSIQITNRTLSFDSAREKFYQNEVRGIIVIPKDFGKNLTKGQRASFAVYTDASYFMIYRQVYTGAFQAASTMSAGIELKKMMMKGIPGKQAMVMRDPVPVVAVPLYNYNSAYGSYLIPVVLIIILQQTLLIGIGMLGGTSRERKTLHFMIPDYDVRRFILPVIAGKALAYFLLYSVYVFYFFGVLFKIYGYPHNAGLLSIYIYFIPFLLAVIFLSLSISTFFRSRESSVMFLLCTAIPFVLFSGFSWPVNSIPGWLYNISLLIPSTKGIEGFIQLNMMGAGFGGVLSNWFFLWFLALIYLVFAVVSFRRFLSPNRRQRYLS